MNIYSNAFWSVDYKTGIEGLNQQTAKSIKQLHDLRKLIFSYVSFYYNSSERLQETEMKAYSNNGFEISNSDGTKVPKQGIFGIPDLSHPKRIVSETHKNVDLTQMTDARSLDGIFPINDESKHLELSKVYEMSIRGIHDQSQAFEYLAAIIDKDILEKVTHFIKAYEPYVNDLIVGLLEDLEHCQKVYKDLCHFRQAYEDLLSVREFSRTRQQNHVDANADATTLSSTPSVEATSIDKEDVDGTIEKDVAQGPASSAELEDVFQFPLFVGRVLKLNSQAEMKDFLDLMISNIEVVKRKIPLPGYRNEIFSSNQLCDFFIKNRVRGFNPSISNMEKVGQGLMDMKLLVTTSIWPRKFRKEGMWFEWSELAYYMAYPDNQSLTNDEPIIQEEDVSKFVNEVATNTSKTFNNLVLSVRSSLHKTNMDEKINLAEESYNSCYSKLDSLKYNLECNIRKAAKEVQSFEQNRIALSFQSMAKLQELLHDLHSKLAIRVGNFSSFLSEESLKKENYDFEVERLLGIYSTGVYFPSSIFPKDQQASKNYASQANLRFQSIKYKFNYLEDIQLQPKSNFDKQKDTSLLRSSLPYFLFKIIDAIEERSNDFKVLQSAWIGVADYKRVHFMKEEVLKVINTYEPNDEKMHLTEEENHIQIIESIIESFRNENVINLVNFFKYWLLELSDSIIPCSVYEKIISLFDKQKNETSIESSQNEIGNYNDIIQALHILPRCNLSSLLFILEHVANVFELVKIPECKDEEEISLDDVILESNKIKEVCETLNDMSSIGAVPFIHLIFRPSKVKSSSGFKPPLKVYNTLTIKLLDVRFRVMLSNTLKSLEKNYIFRRKNDEDKFNLSVKKLSLAQDVTSSNAKKNTLKPPPATGFTLRPFRTRTPINTPSSSPIRNKLDDEMKPTSETTNES